MSLHDLSLRTLAVIIIAAGVIIVFAISGFQARNLFAPSITEDAQVVIKNEQDSTCIVEGSDECQEPYQTAHTTQEIQYL